MSPWWREEISARLAPGVVALRRLSRGPRRRELSRQTLDVVSSSDASEWRPMVEALRAHLAQRNWRNADLFITLCGNLVRYHVLPWVDNLNDRDALVYAQQSFVAIYGAAAENWAICLNEPARGLPRVAVASERGLIEELRTQALSFDLKLRSVQPVLCAAVQALARVDNRLTGWLAVVEARHSRVARFSGGECVAVRVARFADAPGQHLLAQLEQDALCTDLETASRKLYVHTAVPVDSSPLRDHGWLVLPLATESIA